MKNKQDNIARTMVNNIKLSQNKKSSQEAYFYLLKMKEHTGRSLQSLISEAIINDVRGKMETDPLRKALVVEYENS